VLGLGCPSIDDVIQQALDAWRQSTRADTLTSGLWQERHNVGVLTVD
jgi:hypothetical protein